MDAWQQLIDALPEIEVADALDICHDLTFGPGEVIMSPGVRDPALTYVLSGEVEVRRGGVQLAVCGPGQILGEMGMFRDAPRMAQVGTTMPTRALVLTRAGYDALVEANNPVVFRLERQALEQLGQRLRRLDRFLSTQVEGEADPWLPPPRDFFGRVRDLLFGEPLPQRPTLPSRSVDRIAVVETSHLFRGERYALVQGIAELLEPRRFAAGEILCGQGQPGGPLHLIAHGEGRVVVHVARGRIHQLGTVGPGACVGMTALVDGRPRMASVVATEQVDTLALRRDRYTTLTGRDGQIPSALRRAVIRAFADQVEEAGAALVAIARGDLPGAVSAVATEIYGSAAEVATEQDELA